MVALPCVAMFQNRFVALDECGDPEMDESGNYIWTSEGRAWGRRFIKALESIDNQIRSFGLATTAPPWIKADKFKNKEELRLSNEIARVDCQIANSTNERKELVKYLENAGKLKGLLFETR